MAKLTEVHRRFLLKCFAQYMGPKQAADALAKEFGVTITKQAAEEYNPEARACRGLSKRRQKYYDAERKGFETELKGMPTVQRAVRIRMREQAALKFEETGNYLAMTKLLNDIADEVGDVRTNTRKITGKDGGPVQFEDLTGMTLEQKKAELAALLAKKPAKPPSKK